MDPVPPLAAWLVFFQTPLSSFTPVASPHLYIYIGPRARSCTDPVLFWAIRAVCDAYGVGKWASRHHWTHLWETSGHSPSRRG